MTLGDTEYFSLDSPDALTHYIPSLPLRKAELERGSPPELEKTAAPYSFLSLSISLGDKRKEVMKQHGSLSNMKGKSGRREKTAAESDAARIPLLISSFI